MDVFTRIRIKPNMRYTHANFTKYLWTNKSYVERKFYSAADKYASKSIIVLKIGPG